MRSANSTFKSLMISSATFLSLATTVFLPFNSALAGMTCESVFENGAWSGVLGLPLAPSEAISTLAKLNQLPALRRTLTLQFATSFVNDRELPLSGKILRDTIDLTLERVRKLDYQTRHSGSRELIEFKKALRETLEANGYTAPIIDRRLALIPSVATQSTTATRETWASILGELSLRETRELFYGTLLATPSKESLVGQYLEKTGASARLMRLPVEPKSETMGPERLIVSVSAESFAEFSALILSNPHYMSVVGHAAIMHNGLYFPNEGGKGLKRIRIPNMNHPMPFLILKTSEAERLTQYMKLASTKEFEGWHDGLKRPWDNEGYCARGGYTDCTHWVGNIPIGDKLVTEYKFPPNYEVPGDHTPRVQTLKPFESRDSKTEKLARVWKVPGHEQLASVIGQEKANVEGNLASPGSLINTLVAQTDTDRVPIVFLVVEDHKTPISDKPVIEFDPIR